MDDISPLPPGALRASVDLSGLDFETTDDLEGLEQIFGQDRALRAIRFGIGIARPGFNLFVLGPPGLGKHSAVLEYLREQAAQAPVPPDLCYVNNFSEPARPRCLRLPAGTGTALRADMERLLEALRAVIPATFESAEYQTRIQKIEESFQQREDQAFRTLNEEAGAHQVQVLHTPDGFVFAPAPDGKVLSPQEFEKLPERERQRYREVVTVLEQKLRELLRQMPRWREEARAAVRRLNDEFSRYAVSQPITQLKERYRDFPEVVAYLEEVETDVVANVDDFLQQGPAPADAAGTKGPITPFHRYRVNLLVDNRDCRGAPVVYDDHPTYSNVLGRVEHIAQFGALMTHFTLICAGSLHRANGGYLVLDARKLLAQPFAWEALKRALYGGRIVIEPIERTLSAISTVTLEPEPVPLDVKIVLLGDRLLYYLLHELDPDFGELFKVAADFENSIPRAPDSDRLFARLVATLARRDGLRPFRRDAVIELLEHAVRLAGDRERLTARMRSIADLMQESDYLAGQEDSAAVAGAHVRAAIDAQIERVDRIRDRTYDEIHDRVLLIDTRGEVVGQVNGLSVIDLGNFSFGQPVRITATTRLGDGEVVDIERETELGGPIHSKGVFILSSFLAARYAAELPLSLSASLTFEQSYGPVEGDSASLAELCALLSSLARVPLRQGLAVTGSVNQLGQVQAIGGVNEKIEGFFDVCRQGGLSGDQGVIIPASNQRHLMLRRDVVQAAEAGTFNIHAVSTVDQAIELLTGQPAGVPDADGRFPDTTVNGQVQQRLEQFSRLRQAHGGEGKGAEVRYT